MATDLGGLPGVNGQPGIDLSPNATGDPNSGGGFLQSLAGLGGMLGIPGFGGGGGYGNLSQATNPFAITAGLLGANLQNNANKWYQNALSTVWANNNNANNLGTQGFQSQAGMINPAAMNLYGQGSQLSGTLAPLLSQMQGYQGNIPAMYQKAINSGISPAMAQAMLGMNQTANAQSGAMNQGLNIIGQEGNTPLSQFFSSRGAQLAGTNPLLSTPEAAAIAGNQAATNFKAQQQQAMAQALARGGGPGSQTFGGAQAEGLADISGAGQQAVSSAFQNALLNQQGLGLQQQNQGTQMGALGGNLANTQLGIGGSLLNNASNTQGNLFNQILGGNLAGGQFGLGIGNALNSAQQGMFGQQAGVGQSGFGAQNSGLNSLAQILSGYGGILNSATGAAPGIFSHYNPLNANAFAPYLNSLARMGAPTSAGAQNGRPGAPGAPGAPGSSGGGSFQTGGGGSPQWAGGGSSSGSGSETPGSGSRSGYYMGSDGFMHPVTNTESGNSNYFQDQNPNLGGGGQTIPGNGNPQSDGQMGGDGSTWHATRGDWTGP